MFLFILWHLFGFFRRCLAFCYAASFFPFLVGGAVELKKIGFCNHLGRFNICIHRDRKRFDLHAAFLFHCLGHLSTADAIRASSFSKVSFIFLEQSTRMTSEASHRSCRVSRVPDRVFRVFVIPEPARKASGTLPTKFGYFFAIFGYFPAKENLQGSRHG